MTAPERAAYLIKECGSKEKAVAHVEWVIKDVKKPVTKEFWKEVLELLKKKNDGL